LSEGKTLRSTGEPRENLVRDENRVSNLVSTAIFYSQKMQQNFRVGRPPGGCGSTWGIGDRRGSSGRTSSSALTCFVQRAGIAALSFSNLAVRVSFVSADLDADPVVSKMTQEDADERASSHRSTLFCPSHMITDLW